MTKIKIDKLLRSRRRSIGLEITHEAKLIVRAPRHVSQRLIESIVFKKRSWILNKLNLFQQYKEEHPDKRFIDGQDFYYLGKAYPLKLIEGEGIRLIDSLEFPRSLLPNAKEDLVQWYKACAYKVMQERVVWYSNLTGLQYSAIKISNAKRRFGSCSLKGSLSFNWRLIMAPLEIIDYVVVHELMHLVEKNHSSRFWNKVAAVLPDYKKRRILLRKNYRMLEL